MQFELSRLQGRGLNGLEGQNPGQILTERPRLPPGIDFEGSRCNLNWQGRKAMASMASKAKTEAGFGFSGPSHLLALIFEAAIGPIEPVEALEKLVSYKRSGRRKKRTFAPLDCRLRRSNNSQ